MCIYLRCSDICMSEKFLDNTDIHPIFEKMRCITMTQCVCACFFVILCLGLFFRIECIPYDVFHIEKTKKKESLSTPVSCLWYDIDMPFFIFSWKYFATFPLALSEKYFFRFLWEKYAVFRDNFFSFSDSTAWVIATQQSLLLPVLVFYIFT